MSFSSLSSLTGSSFTGSSFTGSSLTGLCLRCSWCRSLRE
ncbi:pentapeptide repeat-containing protein [Nonomuraea rubra]